MNQRVAVILVLALVISAGASYFVYRAVVSRTSGASAGMTSQIVVAARDIEIGTLIKDVDLKTAKWVGPVPKGVALKPEGLVGRGVIAGIYEGEPMMENRLAPVGAGGGLAATIPAGMRACAVKVNEIVGVAGFVVPGMRVDVLIAGSPGADRRNDTRVKTILQNIEVLSAGQNYQKDAEGKPVTVQVVNLLVTPDQAEILSLASNETRIQLVLRNPLDKEMAKTSGTAIASLFGEPAPAARTARVLPAVGRKAPPKEAVKVAAIPVYLIEVINGPKRSEAKFPQHLEEHK
ncbi:MAG TPA: Flp pilus assembly protein CpaB [Bryobacteraceae bacterium]|nr:Flp pilus assembly protein CpaB [Bryobacteraceae bacterium]